jgi:peroxiredoxin Q/BCP
MSKKSRGKSAPTRSPVTPAKPAPIVADKPPPKAPRATTVAPRLAPTPARRGSAPAKGSDKASVSKIVLNEGQLAPAFDLPRDGGDRVGLQDFAGRKLVLFVYPRANTPGCTKEAIDFSRLASAFAANGTAVLGLSADSVKSQNAFRDKQKLTIPLLSDEKKEVLEAYGVLGEKSMYGKTFLGILRTTVLIDADGRIARIWRNVKVDGHADAVLAAAKAL